MYILPQKIHLQMTEKHSRGQVVNTFTFEQLNDIVLRMKDKGQLIPERGMLRCTLATTKDTRNNEKYAQVDTTFIGVRGKQLVHLICWRWYNNGALLDETKTISHIDADHKVMNLVEESWELNESRKYCHLFKWYKVLTGENRPRCPHWEIPCTGPQ
jgi:hypothetical protein